MKEGEYGKLALLDIVGSALIGGILLLALMRMDENASETTYECQENLTAQQNLTSLVNNIEFDFRKMGYASDPLNVPTSDSMIVHGENHRIKFIGYSSDKGSTINGVYQSF